MGESRVDQLVDHVLGRDVETRRTEMRGERVDDDEIDLRFASAQRDKRDGRTDRGMFGEPGRESVEEGDED